MRMCLHAPHMNMSLQLAGSYGQCAYGHWTCAESALQMCIEPIFEIARAGLQKSYYKLQHAWSPTGLLADLRYFRFSKILILSRHSGHDGHMELSDIVGSCGHCVVLNMADNKMAENQILIML